jgi:hypothetical protein
MEADELGGGVMGILLAVWVFSAMFAVAFAWHMLAAGIRWLWRRAMT